MNVFENIRDEVLNLFDNNGWIKWIHERTTPAYTQKDREANVEYASKSNHCAKCLNINGCCFPKNNMPNYPLHYGCHCRIEPVTNVNFKTECPIEKFHNYAFKHNDKNDKKNLFEKLGYGKMDSEYLQKEYCFKRRKNMQTVNLH